MQHTLEVARYSASDIALKAKYGLVYMVGVFGFGALAAIPSMPQRERRVSMFVSGAYACATAWTLYEMWGQADYIEYRVRADRDRL